ncbi:MAG: UDP-N-acetylmuramoyl-L-alanyl-D-glutamate--2,6-diaminopimelate ligase [Thermodesulfobacteriota bacterium]|nr:UDP-N-acetylmuramoyl-L-alanyl-D-glutamate--2,6-diaminopimelate ligase [Thermodesulfobacteriota bacterium]
MELQQILIDVACLNDIGGVNKEISALYYDSRQVEAGGMFFALPGEVVDGHDYIAAAVERGAVAVVAQREISLPADVQLVVVEDTRHCMAAMAATFYDYPARDLLTVGVTGTNGKTTMTYLIESLLGHGGYNPAVVGTISNRLGDYAFEACHTTPESLDLQRMLAEFRHRGADSLVIEVSSHALMQERVFGLEFDVTVFTNLTPEHLDYHHNMESYFAAKTILFTDSQLVGGHGRAVSSRAVVNSDDPYGAKLITMLDDALSVGSQTFAKIRTEKFTQSLDGIVAKLNTPIGSVSVRSPLIGRFNLENLACAVGVGIALNLSVATIEQGLAEAPRVPGRLERIDNKLSALILVDYAHTGDALEKALQALSAQQPQRIITLFGCGGDRDTAKRAVMAAVAARYSQLTVVTSDNPRSEDPQKILTDICAGIDDQIYPRYKAYADVVDGQKGYVVIEDRAEAIQFTVDQLRPSDLLLVAGKGHEDYQIIGTTKIHFDDREQLNAALTLRSQRDTIKSNTRKQ